MYSYRGVHRVGNIRVSDVTVDKLRIGLGSIYREIRLIEMYVGSGLGIDVCIM